jgi:hypothetical protein
VALSGGGCLWTAAVGYQSAALTKSQIVTKKATESRRLGQKSPKWRIDKWIFWLKTKRTQKC